MRRLALLTATGTATVALMTGMAWASPLSLTLDPNAVNNTASPTVQLVDPTKNTITPFSTDGGSGYAFLGISAAALTGTSVAWKAQATFWIADFTGLSATTTGLGFDSDKGWELFATVNLSGTGDWSGNVLTANSPTTASLDLWGTQGGNATNFGGPSTSSAGITDFTNLGITGTSFSDCYTPSQSPSSTTCLLLAAGSGVLNAGSVFSLDNSGNPNDTISFDLALNLTDESYATGAGGFFGSSTSPFALEVISGCAAVSRQDVAVGGTTGNSPDYSNLWLTPSQGPNSACNPQAAGIDANHDPMGWGFTQSAVINGQDGDIPEPSSIAMLGTALIGLGALVRRRRRH